MNNTYYSALWTLLRHKYQICHFLKVAVSLFDIWKTRKCRTFPTTTYWLKWPVHLLGEDVSSREDASTSWPSSSGLRGRRRSYLTILELPFKKMVRLNQGSILGPLLFLLLNVSDFESWISESKVVGYADDTRISCSSKYVQQLLESLESEAAK
jgi:hypothetical protein